MTTKTNLDRLQTDIAKTLEKISSRQESYFSIVNKVSARGVNSHLHVHVKFMKLQLEAPLFHLHGQSS